jgi:hypothetical protein|tara:strand:- start:280 stop:594 length:315 start_codon:yes stop_codon:yes gene_type:complete
MLYKFLTLEESSYSPDIKLNVPAAPPTLSAIVYELPDPVTIIVFCTPMVGLVILSVVLWPGVKVNICALDQSTAIVAAGDKADAVKNSSDITSVVTLVAAILFF